MKLEATQIFLRKKAGSNVRRAVKFINLIDQCPALNDDRSRDRSSGHLAQNPEPRGPEVVKATPMDDTANNIERIACYAYGNERIREDPLIPARPYDPQAWLSKHKRSIEMQDKRAQRQTSFRFNGET